MQAASAYHMYPCGDHAVTVELGTGIDIAVNRKAIAVANQIRKTAIVGVKDIIPAYNSVTVVYDITLIKRAAGATAYQAVCLLIEEAINETVIGDVEKIHVIDIPVCYDASLAPDLETVAALHNIGADELIGLHSAVMYHVYMTGFLPGFAYMGSVDRKIITPRRSAPRKRVPAGSVGIAGEQTGIYPLESPGGWQLIGQTPIQLFSLDKEEPCYLKAGDAVKFYPIPLTDFKKWKQS